MNKPNIQNMSIVTEALETLDDIATLPEVTVKIIQVVDDSESDPEQLYEVIKHDPALVARVLRVVNSAFYGLPGQVANIKRAISLLGLAAIKNIAIAASMGAMFSGSEKGCFTPKELWKHSMAVAVASRKISKIMGRTFNPDEMFMTGLIHDLGLLVESQAFPEKVEKICKIFPEKNISFLEIEEEIIGATHQDFGNAITLKWRFPVKLRDAISCHHSPENLNGASRELATVLFVADSLCCAAGLGFSITAVDQVSEAGVLEVIGLTMEDCVEVQHGLQDEVDEALALFSGD